MRNRWVLRAGMRVAILILAVLPQTALRADDTALLFDGKTLNGWVRSDGKPITGGWEVVDGAIRRSPGKQRAGHIMTTREFGDFKLSFEWSIAPGGNSGLKYRVRTYGKKVLGCEYQIFDGTRRRLSPKQSTASLYALYPPARTGLAKPPGEFNSAVIIVRKDRIQHWLNGQQVVDARVGSEDWKRRVADSKFSDAAGFGENQLGRIMLTDHGSEVWYRKLRFELLDDDTTSEPDRNSAPREDKFVSLFDGRSLNGWKSVPAGSDSDWSVQNGSIVGTGSANRLVYLVWKDRELQDFELRLRYRLIGKGNTGIEIRSQKDVTGKRPFEGYHADLGHVGIGPHILGAWDFHFARRKEYPCPRGTRLIINSDGSTKTEQIEGALTAEDVRQDDWNDVRIVARGNQFHFYVNHKPASEFTDNSAVGRLDRGAIGLQIHDKGMRVEFKDIRLRQWPAN